MSAILRYNIIFWNIFQFEIDSVKPNKIYIGNAICISNLWNSAAHLLCKNDIQIIPLIDKEVNINVN